MSGMTLGDDSSKPPRRNIAEQFKRYFGNESQLANWLRLCRDIGIQEDFKSIRQCRLALKKVWVNIYDLIDAINDNKMPPRLFKSQAALSQYTIKTERIFPRKMAKKGGPVRALLAHIHS
ncbi:hypothetical protein B2J93_548 [Marssonina coronariae]|uniref:Uncharacterized protein n=1 Tax=Diplocarpon coronariae TaxID=2795749 RepID=A0A218YY01_9HELO|nr:hypothetical protein B2J93_548 [Marssonina coronariae]